MKSNLPVLESVSLHTSKQSILVFEREEPSFDPFWHFHPEIELTLITEGNGIRFVGDHIESYQQGDLVLIGENLPHHWVSKDKEDGLMQKAIVVQFLKEIFEGLADLRSLDQFVLSAKSGLHFANPSEIVVKRIETLLHLAPPLRFSLLIEILFELEQNTHPRKLSQSTKFNILDSSKEQKRINEAISYIVENLSEKLTVNRMADHCCMVPQAFCRWFRKHTGFSFITYLNKTRLETACQHLLTSEKPIKSIAYEVGYENISHFNRTFRKYIGHSPLAFKRLHNSKEINN